MNLQAWVAIAEIASALAVTFTLTALMISIRQNTTSQKALVVDSLAAAIASINVPAMESHALGSAISQSDGKLGFSQSRRADHRALLSLFFLQVVGERLVSTESKNPWRSRLDWMGNIASKILPQRWCAPGLVAGAPARVFARISKVPFRNKTADRTRQLK